MKKADKIAYKQKSPSELSTKLVALKKSLFEVKAKHAISGEKDTSTFKKIKYEIAYISTLLNTKNDN